MLGSEGRFEAVRGLLGESGFRLLGEVRGMMVEVQLDRRAGWVSSVEKLQKFKEDRDGGPSPERGLDQSQGRCRPAG